MTSVNSVTKKQEALLGELLKEYRDPQELLESVLKSQNQANLRTKIAIIAS